MVWRPDRKLSLADCSWRVFLRHDPGFAWACIGAGVLLNLWGIALCSRRSTMRPYVGVQLFLILVTLVNVGIIMMARSHTAGFESLTPQEVKASFPYWVMLVAPACMALMYVVDRRARRHR